MIDDRIVLPLHFLYLLSILFTKITREYDRKMPNSKNLDEMPFHDPDQTLHPTLSDMDLYCLIISYKKGTLCFKGFNYKPHGEELASNNNIY